MVRWRSGKSRAPPRRKRSRSERRSSNKGRESTLTCAAASSMASGSRSTCSQMAATEDSVASRLGCTLCARSRKRVTAAACVNGVNTSCCSARRCNGARLVTSTCKRGQLTSRSATKSAAERTCSKLSRSSKHSLSWRKARTCSEKGRSACSRSPSTCATVCGTSEGSCRAVRSIQARPSTKPARRVWASSSASLVLPTPPGPVRVSRRTPRACKRSSAWVTSCSRPSRAVGGKGSTCRGAAFVSSPGRGGRAAANSAACGSASRFMALVSRSSVS